MKGVCVSIVHIYKRSRLWHILSWPKHNVRVSSCCWPPATCSDRDSATATWSDAAAAENTAHAPRSNHRHRRRRCCCRSSGTCSVRRKSGCSAPGSAGCGRPFAWVSARSEYGHSVILFQESVTANHVEILTMPLTTSSLPSTRWMRRMW